MATVAKGMMTLVNVNDAYTVLATPSTCSIKADFNGANPVLDDACCEITVVRGDVKVPFSIKSVTPSNNGIQYAIDGTDATKRLKLNAIPIDVVTGTVSVEVETEDEFTSTIIFQYSVMRESTMLDWIADWESKKTVIGGNYILTPKLYAGSVKDADGVAVLTGIYIGPDANGAGLYGYNNGVTIFQLNNEGGMIGGWGITETGMLSGSGRMSIDSNGSIEGKDEDGEIVWALYESGNAIFAGGNVKFFADGSAEYAGKITATEGEIAGWNLLDDYMYNDHIMLHGKNAYIGISLGAINENISNDSDHRTLVIEKGGVAMFYQSVHLFGIICHDSLGQNVFSMGSTNVIAGWNFDHEAIYIGTKNNMGGGFADTDSMTIGTNGLRGESWYLDKSGNFNLGCGTLTYDGTSVSLVGWTLTANRISNKYVAMISNDSNPGVYLCNADLTNVSTSNLKTTIESNSGIYMYSNSSALRISAWIEGKEVFKMGSDGNNIGSWNFDDSNLYIGGSTITNGFAGKNCMVLNSNGIYGSAWHLLSDGTGKLAKGNISWDANGVLTIKAKIEATSGTTIDGKTVISNGYINTDLIEANSIKAGKIDVSDLFAQTITATNMTLSSGCTIGGKVSIANQKILLNTDGSGHLASGAITWDASGNGEISGAWMNPVTTNTANALNKTLIVQTPITQMMSISVGSFDGTKVTSSNPIRRVGSVTIISSNSLSPTAIYLGGAQLLVPKIQTGSSNNVVSALVSPFLYFILGAGASVTFDVFDDYNLQARCLQARSALGWFNLLGTVYPSTFNRASYENLKLIKIYSNPIGSSMAAATVYRAFKLPESVVQYMKLKVSNDYFSDYDSHVYFQKYGDGSGATSYTIDGLRSEKDIISTGTRIGFREGGDFGFGYYLGTTSLSSVSNGAVLYVKLYDSESMIGYLEINL